MRPPLSVRRSPAFVAVRRCASTLAAAPPIVHQPLSAAGARLLLLRATPINELGSRAALRPYNFETLVWQDRAWDAIAAALCRSPAAVAACVRNPAVP